MHENVSNLVMFILRESLEIQYCTPGSLDVVRTIKFKTLDEMNYFLQNTS